MNTKLIKAAALATSAAVAFAAVLSGAASAQTVRYAQPGQAYDQQGQYSYDGCQRSETNRSVVGGLTGAAIGAAIGNNSGPAHRHDDNALLGGLLGAVAGAVIGNSSAACGQPSASYGSQPTYTYNSYNGTDYNQQAYDQKLRDQRAYEQRLADQRLADQQAAQRLADQRAQDARRYAAQQPRCTYVESPIHMPDGRTQTRMVEVCQDSSGRYQVVE